MKRLTGYLALASVLALSLGACSAGAEDGAAGGGGGSRTDMVIAQTAEPVNLDFTTTSGAAIPQALMENVYESLVRIDQDGEIQPALAKSWDVSEDRRVYTFHLVDGASFSNGDEFTSSDVKFSYDRVLSDAWTNGLKSKMDVVDSIATPDDATVEITLERPSNGWLFDLASLVGAVFSEDAVDDLANTAVGTGPFAITDFTRGQQIVFTARDDYWGEAPALSEATFKYFSDSVSAVNALKAGDVDVLGNLQAPELAGDIENNDELQLVEGTSNGEIVLSMNNAEGIFADQDAREAVLYALDEQEIMDAAWGGYGTLIGSMVPPTDPYYEDLTGVWPTDPEKAKDLVEKAGIDGEEFSFTVPNLPYATAVSEAVVSQLSEVGLDARIESQEFPAVWLDSTFTQHDYDMSVINHVEARDILTVFGPDYYTGYDNARIADNAAKADAGTPEEYTTGMQEVARTITEDAAADFVFLFPNLVAAKAEVTGIPRNFVSDSFTIAPLAWS